MPSKFLVCQPVVCSWLCGPVTPSWTPSRRCSSLCQAEEHHRQTDADRGIALAPEPMRWHPIPVDNAEADFVDGIHTLAANGDAEAHSGVAAHVYLASRSMERRASTSYSTWCRSSGW
jgi:homogentisate 1,2-dioxygenase